jgi:hypothetical protein
MWHPPRWDQILWGHQIPEPVEHRAETAWNLCTILHGASVTLHTILLGVLQHRKHLKSKAKQIARWRPNAAAGLLLQEACNVQLQRYATLMTGQHTRTAFVPSMACHGLR